MKFIDAKLETLKKKTHCDNNLQNWISTKRLEKNIKSYYIVMLFILPKRRKSPLLQLTAVLGIKSRFVLLCKKIFEHVEYARYSF